MPKGFRTHKAVAKSHLFFTLELIYSYIHNTKRSSLRTRSIHLSGLKHRLAKSAWLFGPEKIQGLSRNGLPERLVKKLKVYSIPRIFFLENIFGYIFLVKTLRIFLSRNFNYFFVFCPTVLANTAGLLKNNRRRDRGP